ncbi:MAG: uncharacterized protein QG673_193, partial [Pseudomonadota bacterium]|nr:uncharacterized protein [Pseudomonadota bacterium]
MNHIISRPDIFDKINRAFRVTKIVCLLGPRQCGKTTIARKLFQVNKRKSQDSGYFDLEKPADIRALENPDFVLPHLKGLIV